MLNFDVASKAAVQMSKDRRRKIRTGLKISREPFHSCTISEAYLINSLRFSEVKFSTFNCPDKATFRTKKN